MPETKRQYKVTYKDDNGEMWTVTVSANDPVAALEIANRRIDSIADARGWDRSQWDFVEMWERVRWTE